MVKIKPFKGIRPQEGLEEQIASKPYDVLNSEEARTEAGDNEMSLYHIIKPEIDFPNGTDEHSKEVYEKAVSNYNKFKTNKWLNQDEDDCLYIYAQTMDNRTQYGIVAAAYVNDYLENKIKKHELTRKDKEEDRMIHVRINNANIEPVFFSYPSNDKLDNIVSTFVKENKPTYDFTSEDNISHHFWVIKNKTIISEIVNIFDTFPCTYVADGHHRSAAAALVGKEKEKENSNHNGQEEYNFFLAVHFPDNQLKIFDYNRVIKDLNGRSTQELIKELENSFKIEEKGSQEYRPQELHTMGMYLENKWYKLTAKKDTYNDSDPIGGLDVTILTNQVLEPIFNIKDLRTDKRIDFIGGIRGLGELEKRVNSGEMKVAFAMYPVSMKQLIKIADSGNIMPPKTTWFEPKLRSGLIIHELN